MKWGCSSSRLELSSFLSVAWTFLTGSDVLRKLPELAVLGVCFDRSALGPERNGVEGRGGVVGRWVGLVDTATSKTAVQISVSLVLNIKVKAGHLVLLSISPGKNKS